MSDRLPELRRQRALIQDHLDWLDREIAAQSGTGEPPAKPAGPPLASQATARLNGPDAASRPLPPQRVLSDPEMDALLDPYRTSPASVQKDVRKGCLLYSVIGMALLALGVLALAFLLRSP